MIETDVSWMSNGQTLSLPGTCNFDTSGTTIKVPIKSHLSPACACSTVSALKIISKLHK